MSSSEPKNVVVQLKFEIFCGFVCKKLEAQFYGIPEDTPDATIMNWFIEQKAPSHVRRQYEAVQKARGQRRGVQRQMLKLPQQENVDSMEI